MESLALLGSSLFASAGAGTAATGVAGLAAGTAASPIGALALTSAGTYAPAALSAGTAAASGGGALSGLALLASAGSFLSSGLQMFAANQSAKMQQNALNFQAQQEAFEAKQIEINAEDQSNALRKKLLDDLASTDAFFAGSGISLGSGTARQAQIVSRARAGEDLGALRSQSSIAALGKRAQSAQTRLQGKFARKQGKLSMLGAVPNLLESGAQLYGGARSLING